MVNYLADVDPADLANSLLSLTGRQELDNHIPQERKRERALSIVETSIEDIRSGLQHLATDQISEEDLDRTVHENINRALLALGVQTASLEFTRTVFDRQALQNSATLTQAVKNFRKLSMFYFGNFRYSYNFFRDSENAHSLDVCWAELFEHHKDEIQDKLRTRPEIEIDPIDGHNLWALGYIAEREQTDINEKRRELAEFLEDAQERGVDSPEELDEMAGDVFDHNSRLDTLIKKTGVNVGLLSRVRETPMDQRIEDALYQCDPVSEEDIDELRAKGRSNTNVYLTIEDLDVYVATSMRSPSDFSTQASLIERVFHDSDLSEVNPRYFDPTQAFSHDRVDKGLLEFLLIMRSKAVLYNAQEKDTFGKDSEAAFALALRKPVIIHVTRLFGGSDSPFSRLFDFLDAHLGARKDELIKAARDELHLDFDVVETLWDETTDADVVSRLIEERGAHLLDRVDNHVIREELRGHGYHFDPDESVVEQEAYDEALREYALETMKALEKRAFTFSEAHPLSLQTSPFDGVARGVMVSRSIEATVDLLTKILTEEMGYEYDYDPEQETHLLRDAVTNSPVRVVTEDDILGRAFWTTFADERERWTQEPRPPRMADYYEG